MTAQVPDARQPRRTALIIWSCLVASVGVYAVVIETIRRQHEPFSGFSPTVSIDTLRPVVAVVWIVSIVSLRFVVPAVLRGARGPAAGQRVSAMIVRAAIYETAVMYGVILFLCAGRRADFYVFAAAGLVGLLTLFPRAEGWTEATRRA